MTLNAIMFTRNKGVINSIKYLNYMIDYDSRNPVRYQIRECDYSLMVSTFLKHYFNSDPYIIAPEHALNDNVKPDFFIVKANQDPILQWLPWLYLEVKDHAAISLEKLLDGQMSKQGEGLIARYDLPNDTIWAVACIGSHISFFKYNPRFSPNMGALTGFKWVPYPGHAQWSMEDYKEFDAFPKIISGQLLASYNLLNLSHKDIIHWHFNNMESNAAI